MKRILNLTALTITALVLLGTVSVMAIERPFALNAKGVATFITDGSGNPVSANVSSSGAATHLGLTTTDEGKAFSSNEAIVKPWSMCVKRGNDF
jgi:hypothetical protein